MILDKRHFKCPVCNSNEIEIEVDWEIPHGQYEGVELRVEISCLECNKNPQVSQRFWSLQDFNKILEQKMKTT